MYVCVRVCTCVYVCVLVCTCGYIFDVCVHISAQCVRGVHYLLLQAQASSLQQDGGQQAISVPRHNLLGSEVTRERNEGRGVKGTGVKGRRVKGRGMKGRGVKERGMRERNEGERNEE